ncbi:hypothetical protein Syn7502_02202 [Synechococcus sp. PCC 7502]|uniref:hypothetical protein n=1 Tax=Synechococcus sp. PCC 7502 TaxID=1173263 RepID=UPI00029FBC91|nr:hypothetical protein [Synechococcus sp. PCC 7502]AFY74211.1 hypothetical protein Syn7502_02202 [Synechococcus sp. PCC 7502]
MVKDSQPEFFIPIELRTLIEELSSLYSPENHGAIAEVLEELISRLKQTDSKPNLASSFSNSNLINNAEIGSDAADVKSWEDLLNFTVYVDTEIYSPNESSEAISDPEVSPEQVVVIAHEEATDAYVHTWDQIATKLQNPPPNLTMRFWSTAEAANILGCSEEKLRRAKSKKQLPLEINNFIVDCPDLKQKKLSWLIRLKSPN